MNSTVAVARHRMPLPKVVIKLAMETTSRDETTTVWLSRHVAGIHTQRQGP